MWENERKKEILRNVIILLLLVIAAAGLRYTMKLVTRQIAAEDNLLKAEHSSQRQELNEARQETLESIKQAYQEDLDAVAAYLPGIVCWGDSLTTGSSGNVSYPLTLQKYIDTYLCEIYDLRYSVENAESAGRVNWEDYKISIPVVNMGSGQEDSNTILGRSGVLPYVVKSDFVIPADKTSVKITLMSPNGETVTPLMAGNAGVNPVTIAGVEGTLTREASNSGASYHFVRLTEGEETPVEKDTQIITASSDEYRDYIHIVWLGTYDKFSNPEDLVEDTKALLQRQISNSDRYLVIGPCTFNGSWSSARSYTMDAIDSAMLQAFGSRYINLRKYLVEDGLRDAGLLMSADDNVKIGQGQVPDSFRSNASGADLNGLAYKLVGKLVYERMNLLGYFDEVREALNLDKITHEILKNDPNYFEIRLNR